MSHKYGEGPLPHSRDLTLPSSPTAPNPVLNEEKNSSIALRPGHSDLTENNKPVDAKDSSSSTESFSVSSPSPDDLKRKSLSDLRCYVRAIVIQRQRAPCRARKKLDTLKLSLIEHITRLERDEEKSKDAARRVVIGRDVNPPPPDPIETPWRKKRFGRNTRRSGPVEPPKRKIKKEEVEEEKPDHELHSTRWKLKMLVAEEATVGDAREWEGANPRESEDSDNVGMKLRQGTARSIPGEFEWM